MPLDLLKDGSGNVLDAFDSSDYVDTGSAIVVRGAVTYPKAQMPGYSIVAGTPPVDLTGAKAALLAAAGDQFTARRRTPMTWNFGTIDAKDDLGNDVGAAGTQTLQMRDDATQDDWKNWLAAAQGAAAAVQAGAGTTVQPIKVTSNVWVQTTAQQLLQVLVLGDGTQTPALARGEKMLSHYGALKAQINAAADEATLSAIDVTAGWPA